MRRRTTKQDSKGDDLAEHENDDCEDRARQVSGVLEHAALDQQHDAEHRDHLRCDFEEAEVCFAQTCIVARPLDGKAFRTMAREWE